MSLSRRQGRLALSALLGLRPCFAQAPKEPPATLSRSEVTAIIADTRRIVSDHGIEVLQPVQINGTTQWLSIRGRDRRNPILLFLHGGPGSPSMPEAYTFQNPWEDYFTVVQWDQRGTGKTYAANDPRTLEATLTLGQMTDDALEVIHYLQKTYGKRKLFLLGHSWGSILGEAVAQREPGSLYAYLGVGQMVNGRKNEAAGYAFALEQARAHHDAVAEQELASLAPYPGAPETLTFARISLQRKWLTFYGGLTHGRSGFGYDANAWLLSPDYTQKDLDAIHDGGVASVTHLLQTMAGFDGERVTRFKCPVFLFEGRHDFTTASSLAAAWFQRLEAPSKRLVWFENSAHMVMLEEPGRFLFHLVAELRPLAVREGDAAPEDEEVPRAK